MKADDVDWTPQDGHSENWVTCVCGGPRYRSHVKVVQDGDTLRTFSRKRCPNCGAFDTVRRADGDPETFSL